MTMEVKRGDTREISFRAKDKNGAVRIQGAANVVFFMRLRRGGPLKTAVLQNLDDGTEDNKGRARMTPPDTFFDPAGLYRGEVQVTFADGSKRTFPSGDYEDVHVVQDLG